MRPALTCCRPHIFNDIYFVDMDIELHELTLQPEEVCDAKWATEDDVLAMLDAGVFIPYHRSFIQYLFALHRAGGNLHCYKG